MHSNTGSKSESKASKQPSDFLNPTEVFALQSQNYRVSERAFRQLQATDQLCALLGCVGLVCAVLAYDLERTHTEEVLAVVVGTGNASTLLLLWSVAVRLGRELRWEQATCVTSQHATFWSAGKHWRFLVETSLNLPHPLWWLKGQSFESYVEMLGISVHYSYNSMLSIWTMLRLYHLFRLVCSASAYRSCRAQRVCQVQGAQAGSWFAARGLMATYPGVVLIVLLFGGACVAGWMLYIFESPLSAYTTIDYSFQNTLWLVLISMTTVGYGDLYPSSTPGRIVVIIACIWGVIILSLVVLALTTQLEPTAAQATSYSLLQRLEFHRNLATAAGSFIATAGKCCHIAKTRSDDLQGLRKHQVALREKINAFQRMRIQRRVLYGVDKFPETLEKELTELEEGSVQSLASVAALKAMVEDIVSLC